MNQQLEMTMKQVVVENMEQNSSSIEEVSLILIIITLFLVA